MEAEEEALEIIQAELPAKQCIMNNIQCIVKCNVIKTYKCHFVAINTILYFNVNRISIS